ncbi:hypothetical protein ACLOJK_025121 [Asimina triloba]
MAFKFTPLTPAVISLLLLLLPIGSLSLQTECLTVPTSVFAVTIKTALLEVGKAVSLLSKLSKAAHGFRLATALSDCSELLELTADELTRSEASRPNGTGRRAADLRAWLSAAFGNQDTCLEGFEGTSGAAKKLLAGSLEEVSSVVGNVLKMVRQVPGVRRPRGRQGKYPSWMMGRERRLVEAPPAVVVAAANVTVALDGSGNYTTVGEAVAAAPEESMERYVIHVKRGVYMENVEVKKKKWNVMLVGDGMDATVISGNRSYVDGWTTFRSATFVVDGRFHQPICHVSNLQPKIRVALKTLRGADMGLNPGFCTTFTC